MSSSKESIPPWRSTGFSPPATKKQPARKRVPKAAAKKQTRVNKAVRTSPSQQSTSGDISGNEARYIKLVKSQVEATPGANLRQISRYTVIPLSTTARLVDELEESGVLESETDGSYRCFFPRGQRIPERQRVVLTLVNKLRPRGIMELLVDNPGIRHGDLAGLMGLPAPTLTYYMKQIVDKDLVKVRKDGATKSYRLKNPDLVSRMLDRTKKGFDGEIAKG